MKILLTNILIGFCCLAFGQEYFRLGNTIWQYQKPEGFQYSEISQTNDIGDSVESEILMSISKGEPGDLNKLTAYYFSDDDFLKITPAIFVKTYSVIIRKAFEEEGYTVQTEEPELKKIDGVNFFLIHAKIEAPDTDYIFILDTYIAEVNGKKLNISIFYDNDEDKATIEESLFNSKFNK